MFACTQFICSSPGSADTCFTDHAFQFSVFVEGCLYCDNFDCNHCVFFDRETKRCNFNLEVGDHDATV